MILPRFAWMASLLPVGALAAFHSNTTACTRTYTVKSGDTCDTIGQKTLTSTFQILALNLLDAGSDCYTLEIGSQLCLGRFGNDCQFVHTCGGQDTCDSIAGQYGLSVERLKDNNPILDCDVVYDGLVLCVSQGSIRPPAADSINSTMIQIQREAHRERIQQQQIAQAKSKKTAKLGNQRQEKSATKDSKAQSNGTQSKKKSEGTKAKDGHSKKDSKTSHFKGAKDGSKKGSSSEASSHHSKDHDKDEPEPSKSLDASYDLKNPSHISSAHGTNATDPSQLVEEEDEDCDEDEAEEPTRAALATHRRRRFTARTGSLS